MNEGFQSSYLSLAFQDCPSGEAGSLYLGNLLWATEGKIEGFQSSYLSLAFQDCPSGEAGSRYLGNDLLST
jgi:hypothetical protein